MASIYERTYKNGKKNYWLREKLDGKTMLTYLGTKYPIPKNMARTGLPDNWVERLKRKTAQKSAKPPPNHTLPEGRYPIVYADPPWRYDFNVEIRAKETPLSQPGGVSLSGDALLPEPWCQLHP